MKKILVLIATVMAALSFSVAVDTTSTVSAQAYACSTRRYAASATGQCLYRSGTTLNRYAVLVRCYKPGTTKQVTAASNWGYPAQTVEAYCPSGYLTQGSPWLLYS